MNLKSGKISVGQNSREIVHFLDQVNINDKIGYGRRSDSSYMIIEVSDVDVKDQVGISRSITGQSQVGDYGPTRATTHIQGQYGSYRPNPS